MRVVETPIAHKINIRALLLVDILLSDNKIFKLSIYVIKAFYIYLYDKSFYICVIKAFEFIYYLL